MARIIQQRYDKVIGDLKQTEDLIMADMISKISEKLKVEAIAMEIKHLEEKKVMLENKVKELGFQFQYGKVTGLEETWSPGTFGRNSERIVDTRTPAGRLYYKLCKARPDVRKLEEERDKAIAELWLSEEKTQVRKILDTPIRPMLAKPTAAALINAE